MDHVVLRGWSIDLAAQAFPDARVVALHDDVAAVVDLAVSGARVVACVPVTASEQTVDLLVAELRRIGEVHVVTSPPITRAVPDDARALLNHLADGCSLGEAAAREHLSRRTADRRLAAARNALGVTSTAEAVAALRSRPMATTVGGRSSLQPPVLVGRETDLARLVGLLTDDRSALLVGEGGVGKTALLRAAATATSGRSVRMTAGQETLRWRDYRVLSRLLPGEALVGDVESVAARLEAAVGPDLVVVDDVHLADEATLAVLAALVGRVTLLCAARPDARGADAASAVARLEAAGAESLSVHPLPDADVARLARALSPGLPAERVDEVVADSGGLPLLVELLCGDAGAEAGRGLVPSVAGLSPGAAGSALELALARHPRPRDDATPELVRAGIATMTDDGEIRIRHALVADAVVAAAEDADIRSAHRRLALVAEDPAAAAAHFAAAGDTELAVERAVAAAESAVRQSDRARAMGLAASSCRDDRRTALWLSAAEAYSVAGSAAQALAAADRVDRDLLEAVDRGRLALARARALWHLGQAEESVAAAREGAAAVAGRDQALEGALLGEVVAREALSIGPQADHDDLLARAMTLIGTGPGQASLLNTAGILAHLQRGDGLDEWSSGREAALAEGDLDALMRTSNNVITWHESNGDQAFGLALAREMAASAAAQGLGEWHAQFRAMAANLLMFRGRFAEALGDVDAVEATAVDPITRAQAFVTRVACLIELGLLDAARALIPPIPERVTTVDEASLALLAAWWALAAGRPREAVAVVDDLLAGAADQGDRPLLYLRGHLGAVRAWAEHDLGRPVRPLGEVGPTRIDQLLGREANAVAVMDVDPARAADLLDAVAADGRDQAYGYSLRARWGAAEARRRAGLPTAVEALLALESEVDAVGMEPLLARVRRSLRLAGIRRAARRARDRSGVLTERERQVLDLVAQGGTYTEIARRLGVGRPTVRRLVENARIKLGARDRIAAVAAIAT